MKLSTVIQIARDVQAEAAQITGSEYLDCRCGVCSYEILRRCLRHKEAKQGTGRVLMAANGVHCFIVWCDRGKMTYIDVTARQFDKFYKKHKTVKVAVWKATTNTLKKPYDFWDIVYIYDNLRQAKLHFRTWPSDQKPGTVKFKKKKNSNGMLCRRRFVFGICLGPRLDRGQF